MGYNNKPHPRGPLATQKYTSYLRRYIRSAGIGLGTTKSVQELNWDDRSGKSGHFCAEKDTLGINTTIETIIKIKIKWDETEEYEVQNNNNYSWEVVQDPPETFNPASANNSYCDNGGNWFLNNNQVGNFDGSSYYQKEDIAGDLWNVRGNFYNGGQLRLYTNVISVSGQFTFQKISNTAACGIAPTFDTGGLGIVDCDICKNLGINDAFYLYTDGSPAINSAGAYLVGSCGNSGNSDVYDVQIAPASAKFKFFNNGNFTEITADKNSVVSVSCTILTYDLEITDGGILSEYNILDTNSVIEEQNNLYNYTITDTVKTENHEIAVENPTENYETKGYEWLHKRYLITSSGNPCNPSGFTCTCPDFTQQEKEGQHWLDESLQESNRVTRSWAGSEAGPFNPCKHIMAVKRLLGIEQSYGGYP